MIPRKKTTFKQLYFTMKKSSSAPGFEPGIFWSVVRRVIHCATHPFWWLLSQICAANRRPRLTVLVGPLSPRTTPGNTSPRTRGDIKSYTCGVNTRQTVLINMQGAIHLMIYLTWRSLDLYYITACSKLLLWIEKKRTMGVIFDLKNETNQSDMTPWL